MLDSKLATASEAGDQARSKVTELNVRLADADEIHLDSYHQNDE